MMRIDQKYGGIAKKDQLVREGHFPKISEMIDKLEKIALEFVNYEHYLETARTRSLKDHRDLKDLQAGKKNTTDLEEVNSQESISDLMAVSSKKRSLASSSDMLVGDENEKVKVEEKYTCKHPMNNYDHGNSTYHMGLYKASKWDPKVASNRVSPFGGRSRKAPFTLSELYCKDQKKAIDKIKVNRNLNTQLVTGKGSIDQLYMSGGDISLKHSEISPTSNYCNTPGNSKGGKFLGTELQRL